MIAGGLQLAAPLRAQSDVHVGPNVQVSTSPPATEYGETWAAADPQNPNRLVATWMVYGGMADYGPHDTGGPLMVVFTSSDGGLTWRRTLDDGGHGDDPALAFTPSGVAVFASIDQRESANGGRGLGVWFSDDGGERWQLAHFKDPRGMFDRLFVTSDHTHGRFRGHVYVTGMGSHHSGILLYRSADGGRTYEPPVAAKVGPGYVDTTAVNQTLNCAVMADGGVVMLANQLDHAIDAKRAAQQTTTLDTLKLLRWRPGGEAFDTVFTVSAIFSDWRDGQIALDGTLAVDAGTGPFADRLYVVWQDVRSGRTQIFFSASADGGKHWSTPRVLDDDNDAPTVDHPARPNSITASIAVNRDGVIGVTWYDRRGSGDNLGHVVRFRASRDGGETWTPPVVVSTAPGTVDDPAKPSPTRWLLGEKGPGILQLMRSPFEVFPGHTTGLTADAAGRFHPVWIDNRTGSNAVWTAAVTVPGRSRDPAAVALAGLRDVTPSIELNVRSLSFDRVRQIVTVDIGLKDTTAIALHGPIKVRLGGLLTPAAQGHPPQLLTGVFATAPGESGVIDASPFLQGGILRPGEVRWIEHVQFRVAAPPVTEIVRYDSEDYSAWSFVEAETRVFAP